MNKNKKRLKAIKSIQNSRKLLRALEDLSKVSQDLEQKFADELHLFFQYLGRKVIENVDLEDPLGAIFYQQANGVIKEYWKEYDEILKTYVDKAGMVGDVYGRILLSASKDYAEHFESLKSRTPAVDDITMDVWEGEELFASNPRVRQILDLFEFEASEKTMNRVTSSINMILSFAYAEGWGHYHIAEKLQERFTQLSTYESRRIAQTEINTARNYVHYHQLSDEGMEYKIWMAAKDARVRPSHKKVDREIVPINELFSNGLEYAGDKNGEIEEWINCRCSIAAYIIPRGYEAPAFFPFKEKDLIKVSEDPKPTDYISGYEHPTIATGVDLNGRRLLDPMELLNMSFEDIAKHHDAKYLGIIEYDYDGKKYHTFEQNYDNGKTLTFRFEDKAVKSFTKKGWVHPNSIVDQVFKVPDPLKRQTDEIWFKNTNTGLTHKPFNKTKYDTLGATTGGYNQRKYYDHPYAGRSYSPDHKIVINPKWFKGSTDKYDFIWENGGRPYGGADDWIMCIHHEFSHSIDWSREMYAKDGLFDDSTISWSHKYEKVHQAERWFTNYANGQRTESFAEHMGYVSRMLANPDEQNLKISCKYLDPEEGVVNKEINFEEYKELYPKHYDFCVKLLTGVYTMKDFYPDN